jgi:hypothetical protein
VTTGEMGVADGGGCAACKANYVCGACCVCGGEAKYGVYLLVWDKYLGYRPYIQVPTISSSLDAG